MWNDHITTGPRTSGGQLRARYRPPRILNERPLSDFILILTGNEFPHYLKEATMYGMFKYIDEEEPRRAAR